MLQREAFTRKAIELALNGDTIPLRLYLERFLPRSKDINVILDLPEMPGALSTAEAMGAILTGIENGDLAQSEAPALSSLLESDRKARNKATQGGLGGDLNLPHQSIFE